MDIEKTMVLIKGEDKTKFITSISCGPSPQIIIVEYNGGSSYSYNASNVTVLVDPESEDLDGRVAYVNGMPVYEPRLILNFKKLSSEFKFQNRNLECRRRIIYKNGSFKTVLFRELSFLKDSCSSERARQTLSYLREISKYTADDPTQEVFLEQEMQQLTFIHPESVLGRYLNGQPIEDLTLPVNGIIFPFRFNLSQKAALENALTHSLSVIEGPPGTGKTQTILNILANLVAIQGKSVAVVSNNNEAVKNVIEKMTKGGYGFLTALLGNKANQDAFFANSPVAEVADWDCDESEDELIQIIENLNVRLATLLEIDRKGAQLKQQLQAWQLEQEHFNEYYIRQNVAEVEKLPLLRANSDRIISFLAETSLAKEQEYSEKLIYKVKMLIKYRGSFRSLKRHEASVLLQLERAFYQKQIQKIKDEIAETESKLEHASFDKLLEEHQNYSEKLFRKCLYQSHSKLSAGDFTKKNFKSRFQEFIRAYPIILSTTHAIRHSIPKDYLLDYVIIDEASQVDLITGVLAFSCCRNAIVVGDIKQLPQITNQKIKETLKSAPPAPVYDYFEHSILSSIISLYGKTLPRVVLREHYRCHPQIIEFCNQKYYNGDLIPYTSPTLSKMPLVLYKTVEGNPMRKVTRGKEKGKYNQRELDVIVEEVLNNPDLAADSSKIGFVTPYRKQADTAGRQLPKGIESDTVHKYQGREKDLMILSTVLDNSWMGQRGLEFVDDPHMVNVAVSRAVRQFVLVTDHDLFFKKGKNIGDLIRYMQYSTLDENIIESQVVSVFDLLYKQYSRKLLPLKVKMNSKARFQSEEALRVLLEEILAQPEYNRFSYVQGMLLRNLLNSLENLSDEEITYINNRASLDFVVFYKQDKTCKLVVEVDGFSFHENRPEQLRRDALKDAILTKYNIPFLRLATNGSGERERIIHALQ